MTVYLDYFGLRQPPFSITPDPGCVYLSRRHEEALAHLLYGIGRGGSGGFVQLTGEVGTGKTTLCRCLLEQVPEDTHIALILNPMLSPVDLLQAMCEELDIDYQRDFSARELVNALNQFLLQAHAGGERVVLVIDEAQNLRPEALEQVRLLTNLETHTDKLLQIILLGQPELRDLLATAGLRQLAQRITARYHLQPLDAEETTAYVRHRLNVAGRQQPLFSRAGYRALYKLSGGIPRLINIYADRALMGAYAADAEKISAAIVQQAGREVGQQRFAAKPSFRPMQRIAVLAVGLLLLVTTGWWWQQQQTTSQQQAIVTQPTGAQERGAATAIGPDAAPNAGPAIAGSGNFSSGNSNSGALSSDQATAASGAVVDPVAAELPSLPALIETVAPTQLWHRWAELWQTDADVLQRACADNTSSAASENTRTGSGTAADPQPFFCTTIYGSWGRIRQLQLPVVIMLSRTAESDHQLSATTPMLVESLTDGHALLHNGAQNRRTEMAAISPYWRNEQLTVVCPGRADAWAIGDNNADIAGLKRQAAGLHLQSFTGVINMQYDQAFANWVGRYQLRNGLQVDQILGKETRLFLCAESLALHNSAIQQGK